MSLVWLIFFLCPNIWPLCIIIIYEPLRTFCHQCTHTTIIIEKKENIYLSLIHIYLSYPVYQHSSTDLYRRSIFTTLFIISLIIFQLAKRNVSLCWAEAVYSEHLCKQQIQNIFTLHTYNTCANLFRIYWNLFIDFFKWWLWVQLS